MSQNKTRKGLLLIGYQNDYFAEDGVLRGVVAESVQANNLLENTLSLIDRSLEENVSVFVTPIKFFDDYRELDRPVGILKTCKEVGAFKRSSSGSDTIPELKKYGDAIKELPGKTGLNAFSNTELLDALRALEIEELLIAGVVTSVCIDSTARYAADQGFRVSILSDCTAGRNSFEQEYYCEHIFPIFAQVTNSKVALD